MNSFCCSPCLVSPPEQGIAGCGEEQGPKACSGEGHGAKGCEAGTPQSQGDWSKRRPTSFSAVGPRADQKGG